jgi:hypothetical protein
MRRPWWWLYDTDPPDFADLPRWIEQSSEHTFAAQKDVACRWLQSSMLEILAQNSFSFLERWGL